MKWFKKRNLGNCSTQRKHASSFHHRSRIRVKISGSQSHLPQHTCKDNDKCFKSQIVYERKKLCTDTWTLKKLSDTADKVGWGCRLCCRFLKRKFSAARIVYYGSSPRFDTREKTRKKERNRRGKFGELRRNNGISSERMRKTPPNSRTSR